MEVEGSEVEGIDDPGLVVDDVVVAVVADADDVVSVLAGTGRAEFASVSSITD